jgi:integrase/recombinase XerD
MNTLREALSDYLELRRGLGFKMHDAGLQLPRFVSFLEQCGEPRITSARALQWAQQSTGVQPAEWARRLGFVRGFARYRSATDVATEIPAVGLLPHRSKRARPYLYTEQDIGRLLAAALTLPTAWPSTPLRPLQFHCLLGLLSVTGLRIAEALHLELRDVDLEQSVLTIRAAKHGRSRLVPIHPSTVTVLTEYLRCREQLPGAKGSRFVFISNTGGRLDGGTVHLTFYALSRQVGLRAPGASHGPRLHDLRHRFAVQTLLHWYAAGEDVARRLPVLSTFLGHVQVADTYWYLSAWPELMEQAMVRLEKRWGAAS